jgi:hypothetical protein
MATVWELPASTATQSLRVPSVEGILVTEITLGFVFISPDRLDVDRGGQRPR